MGGGAPGGRGPLCSQCRKWSQRQAREDLGGGEGSRVSRQGWGFQGPWAATTTHISPRSGAGPVHSSEKVTQTAQGVSGSPVTGRGHRRGAGQAGWGRTAHGMLLAGSTGDGAGASHRGQKTGVDPVEKEPTAGRGCSGSKVPAPGGGRQLSEQEGGRRHLWEADLNAGEGRGESALSMMREAWG